MDVLNILRAAVRRWYVTIPIIVLGVVYALHQQKVAKPTYSVSTSLIVLYNQHAGQPTHVINPYAQSIQDAANVVEELVGSPAVQQAAAADGAQGAVSASIPQQHGLIVVLTAASGNRAAVVPTLQAYVSALSSKFDSLQQSAGAPSAQLLQLQQVDKALPAPTATYSHRSRTLAAIIAAGIVLALLAAVALDTFIRRRRGEPAQSPAFADIDEPYVAAAPTATPTVTTRVSVSSRSASNGGTDSQPTEREAQHRAAPSGALRRHVNGATSASGNDGPPAHEPEGQPAPPRQ